MDVGSLHESMACRYHSDTGCMRPFYCPQIQEANQLLVVKTCTRTEKHMLQLLQAFAVQMPTILLE